MDAYAMVKALAVEHGCDRLRDRHQHGRDDEAGRRRCSTVSSAVVSRFLDVELESCSARSRRRSLCPRGGAAQALLRRGLPELAAPRAPSRGSRRRCAERDRRAPAADRFFGWRRSMALIDPSVDAIDLRRQPARRRTRWCARTCRWCARSPGTSMAGSPRRSTSRISSRSAWSPWSRPPTASRIAATPSPPTRRCASAAR